MPSTLPELQVKKLHRDAKLPTKATKYDAAYDLYALEYQLIKPQSKAIIKTGIAIKMPTLTSPFKVYGSIRSRSGLSAKYNLEVGAGVIDESYTGEICVILYNHTPLSKNNEDEQIGVEVQAHDRIAQLILEVRLEAGIIEVDKLDTFDDNDRCDRGFGSSGN